MHQTIQDVLRVFRYIAASLTGCIGGVWVIQLINQTRAGDSLDWMTILFTVLFWMTGFAVLTKTTRAVACVLWIVILIFEYFSEGLFYIPGPYKALLIVTIISYIVGE